MPTFGRVIVGAPSDNRVGLLTPYREVFTQVGQQIQLPLYIKFSNIFSKLSRRWEEGLLHSLLHSLPLVSHFIPLQKETKKPAKKLTRPGEKKSVDKSSREKAVADSNTFIYRFNKKTWGNLTSYHWIAPQKNPLLFFRVVFFLN